MAEGEWRGGEGRLAEGERRKGRGKGNGEGREKGELGDSALVNGG